MNDRLRKALKEWKESLASVSNQNQRRVYNRVVAELRGGATVGTAVVPERVGRHPSHRNGVLMVYENWCPLSEAEEDVGKIQFALSAVLPRLGQC